MIRLGMAGWTEIGTRMAVSSWMTYLAEAQERAGCLDDALETIQEALEVHPDELADRPETLRLCGELRLKNGQTQIAEAVFREAITLAISMGAKAWEMRTTMSLARLLVNQGSLGEACTMLAEIYGWFTQGFDTAD